MQATNTALGEAGRFDAHQFWNLYDPANMDFYRNENREHKASWHRELPLVQCT